MGNIQSELFPQTTSNPAGIGPSPPPYPSQSYRPIPSTETHSRYSQGPDRIQLSGKKEKVMTFDGKGDTDFQDFMVHFETVAAYNGWGEYDRDFNLSACLRGPALKVLRELTITQLNDYGELKKCLKARFSPSEREYAHKQVFRGRCRQGDETLEEYGSALRSLASQAYPDEPATSRESNSIEQFIEGLGSIEVKRYVQFSHPKTLEEAVSNAIEIEAFSNKHGRLPKKPTQWDLNPTPQVCAVNKEVETLVDSTKGDDFKSWMMEQIAKLEQKMEQCQAKAPSYRKQGRIDMSKKVCFICGELGHITYTCPNRKGGDDDKPNPIQEN